MIDAIFYCTRNTLIKINFIHNTSPLLIYINLHLLYILTVGEEKMRKHIMDYYKSYDGKYENGIEKIIREQFNEYGYNFDTNRKREIDYDALVTKTDYKNVKNALETKER